ncbi:response regulator [Natronolimnohabitans sp. A-GB9]|uniref:response regulator n=1 Tax=Natronolimnohabitans sp. A-GB9 TaxID=3069757 RepID=UPI0027B3AE9E|nr:response regulator [Natronolimnohabitans sp. A-GB9]MDQ2051914.1 response regulator [Natronolimnohabitans sp. A-GB9]
MTDQPSEPIRILLVEDNPGDVRLVKEAFREVDVETRFHTVHDGDAALEFLYTRQQNEDTPELDLVLLDLNLPRKSGFDVLETVESDSDLTAPPILVLTSSEATEDVARSYELCANAYLTKPTDPDEFTELGRAVEAFWFAEATLPPAAA